MTLARLSGLQYGRAHWVVGWALDCGLWCDTGATHTRRVTLTVLAVFLFPLEGGAAVEASEPGSCVAVTLVVRQVYAFVVKTSFANVAVFL